MKFSKPINREVEIDGNSFIVSFDDNGIDFRVKGKRRTAHVAWTDVLNISQGEQGANGREFLGIEGGRHEPQQAFEPQATGSQETADTSRDELGRAVGAGEVGPES